MALQQNLSHNMCRLYFLDNLRTFIIFLVVVYHAGWVYESNRLLSSIWIIDDPVKNGLAPLIGLLLDMFIMPVMFFISGFFSPKSIDTQQGWKFILSRLRRLMIPWFIAVLTLIPLYKVIYLYSRGLPQQDFFSYFHFSGGILINQGWLWFLPVLFLCDILYFFLAKTFPTKLRPGLKTGIMIVFLTGVIYSTCMSLFKLSGWTKTFIIDFQNERILIYFLMFLLGTLCYRHKVLDTPPNRKIWYYIACSTIWIPMNLYIIFIINLFTRPGNYLISLPVDLILAWTGLHLTFLGMTYILINTFRFYFNRGGSLAKALGQYSYGVYIIHFIVMGFIALVLLKVALPSLTKYFLLIATTFVCSNLIMFLYKSLRASIR